MKNLKNLGKSLTRIEQKSIIGGQVSSSIERCCIRVPTHGAAGNDDWCNDSPACKGVSSCAC